MKLWIFRDPFDYRFARATRRGTWSKSEGICPECTASGQRRIQPLIFEWEPDSDVVGDFVWPGLGADIAITDRGVKVLERFTQFELGPIEMNQDPKLKKTRRSKPRVWLPYEGPALHDLWVTCWVGVDMARSTATLERECSTCGAKQYSLFGVEGWDSRWDKERKELIKTHIPREPGKGLFIHRDELKGADIFHVKEFPGAIFCSDSVKHAIEKEGLTNVSFLEMGDII